MSFCRCPFILAWSPTGPSRRRCECPLSLCMSSQPCPLSLCMSSQPCPLSLVLSALSSQPWSPTGPSRRRCACPPSPCPLSLGPRRVQADDAVHVLPPLPLSFQPLCMSACCACPFSLSAMLCMSFQPLCMSFSLLCMSFQPCPAVHVLVCGKSGLRILSQHPLGGAGG
jgi:hypothetical protein